MFKTLWEFPGSPVVRALCFHCGGRGVQFLVAKLRSRKSMWPKTMLILQYVYSTQFKRYKKVYSKISLSFLSPSLK